MRPVVRGPIDWTQLRREVPDWLQLSEWLVNVLIAILLVLGALFILAYTVWHVIRVSPTAFLVILNDILLVIIVLEILATIVTHLRGQRYTLEPFLIVGIIASIRRLLITGAEMSDPLTKGNFRQNALDLGLSTLIILVLVVSYYLVSQVRRSGEAIQERR